MIIQDHLGDERKNLEAARHIQGLPIMTAFYLLADQEWQQVRLDVGRCNSATFATKAWRCHRLVGHTGPHFVRGRGRVPVVWTDE